MLRGRTFAVLVFSLLIALTGCKKGPTQEALFEKAKKAQEESNFPAAIDAYQEIVKLYPKSPQAPQCQFMVGYLYANHLKMWSRPRRPTRPSFATSPSMSW